MLFVGVMTGTSVDGLDLALLELPSNLKPQAFATIPFLRRYASDCLRSARPMTTRSFKWEKHT